jgi:hypothetical protein
MNQTLRHRPLAGRFSPVLVALVATADIVACAGAPTLTDGVGERQAATAGGRPGSTQQTAAASVPETQLTPAEQRMRRQSKAFQRTVWEGALLGATAGAILQAYAIHGIKGVLSATAVGGATGGLAGSYLATKQKEYAAVEAQLDSMIADVRQSNRQAETLIATAREVLAEDRRRLAAVEQRYRSGQATEADLVAARGRIKANRSVVQSAVTGAREQKAMFAGAEQSYRAQNPGVATTGLSQELEAYRQQIETLDALAKSIAAA